MYKVIGIDEAGRGPVIGSMFVGFSIAELENKTDLDSFYEKLKNLGVKDSKLLTPKKRNEIYLVLKEIIRMKYVQLTPTIIDENHYNGGKLNALEKDAIIKILDTEKPNLVILDALTSNPKKFGEEIKKRLSFECKIISENKADSKYEIVGAASIIAKELRELEITEIKKNICIECGSGYPSDPATKSFLKEHYNNKEFDFIFRKSWQTYKQLVGDKVQKTLSDF